MRDPSGRTDARGWFQWFSSFNSSTLPNTITGLTMHSVLVLAAVVAILPVASDADPFPAPTLREVGGTDAVYGDQRLLFTISPDDRWLFFFKRDDLGEDPLGHYAYGRPRLLNLRTGAIHAFTIPESEERLVPLAYIDACWAHDSSLCVLPPPPTWPNISGLRILISLPKDGPPSLSLVTDENAGPLPESFTCSDCAPRADDLELLRRHIPKEFLIEVDTWRAWGEQAVSPDGTKLFYQQRRPVGPPSAQETEDTILFEIDVTTGAQRALVVHHGLCARIFHLRPSPDGRFLAYQLTREWGFVSVPEVHVLELATGTNRRLVRGLGPMRWSSSSDRLYFVRHGVGDDAEVGDRIWFAEFAKADGGQE